VKLAIINQIPAARERVFAALVDAAVLRRTIPGCESLTSTGPDAYEATLRIGVAGLKGTYAGKAAVRDKRPPDSLTLAFEGRNRTGFVSGSAAIALSAGESSAGSAAGRGTPMTAVVCEADVQVGGLIAAVGSRLVEAAARKLAADFFRELSTALQWSDQEDAARL
jgi:carbon monoxide dehydrogenase subunit G